MFDDPPRLADPRAVLPEKSRDGVREKQNVKLQLAGSQVVVSSSARGKLFHRSLRVLTRRVSCVRPCPDRRRVFPMSGERRSQPLQREEEGGGSTPRKLARVLSDEAGIVTMAAPSPLMLGLGLGLGRGVGASKPVFTFMQLQELEHQALIYKYMAAGLPVPVQLVLPIWKSVAASSFDHYSYPSCLMGYGACAWTIGTSWCRCQGGAGGPTAKSGGAPETSSPTRSTASATCTGAATVQESPWKRELPPPSPPLPPSSVAAACLRQDSACRTLASFKTTPLLDLPVGEGRHRRHEASPQLVGSGG
ncbi:QLQ [Musa troglodytarum]|uniref:Growth-regulating factor n=1 Tax=Musa troglodytarum TaxID=320322 RepID=A0A9E7H045_9LILI|nr:QLQ [Musa troglodytarum]